MGIALLAVSTLAHPLNTLHRWWRTRDALTRLPDTQRHPAHLPREGSYPAPATWAGRLRGTPRGTSLALGAHGASTNAVAPATRAPTAYAAQRAARHALCPTAAQHPVRVLRRNPASSGAGRMVIAGRMADVCAELERLAACEPPY